FVGERLPLPQRWKTRYGELSIELYYHDSEEAEAGIAVCKDGTRVLRHISELEDFQHAPWTDRRLSGVIDYPALNLAPGTRSGIVPDERLVGFAAAVLQAEAAVARELSSREEAESARASRDILKQVHKAFVSALNELPANEYLFFDIPKSRAGAGKSADDRQLAAGVLESEQDAAVTVRGAADEDLGQKLLPLTPGPLGAVRITPRNSRREVRTECVLSAAVFDDIGIPLDTEVKCQWHIQEGKGRFVSAAGQQCTVTASEPGHLVISVEATQKSVRVSDQVVVKFVPETGLGKDDSGRGLPSYRLESESGRPWRSRYDVERNEIIINSAHRDFIASQGTPAKHRRYVGKLYAKEVVLINFPHGAPGDVLERLVEITLRTEDVL
ncbi:MAG: hypothetical protein JSS02_24110, partial [Planctomycetes bacterium]|nr:hypothetical protein [Planctomycetota bacterium]